MTVFSVCSALRTPGGVTSGRKRVFRAPGEPSDPLKEGAQFSLQSPGMDGSMRSSEARSSF